MRGVFCRIVFCSLAAIFFYLNAAYAVTIRVPSEQPTIQDGIDAAVNGDTVLVADGTYTGSGNKEIEFRGKAITVKSENGPTRSIIDCQGSGRGFYFDGDERSDSVLSGFTIKNGFAEEGAGILVHCSSPSITNCIITNNVAIRGGGINLPSNCNLGKFGTPSVINCIISNNSADRGGGIHAPSLRNTHMTITNCTITDNIGNGIYSYTSFKGSPISVINSILWGNTPNQLDNDGDMRSHVIYSDIQDGWSQGTGNIDTNPLFIENYRLSENSPCINAGTSDGAPSDDIDGDLRPQGLAYDMGADEYVSADLVEAFVTRFYNQCLNRVPETVGLNNWVNALKHGTQSGADVANGFIFSQEFIDRNTLNEEFVVILYRAFFDREPDAGGYIGWVDALFRGVSRQDVLNGFIYSTEFENLCNRYGIKPYPDATSTADGDVEDFVTRFYQQCLGREPDAPGLEGWVSALRNGTLSGADVANRFIFSPEFTDRHTTNEEFVTILYRAFFGREPDTAGYNGWVNYLYSGASRQDALNGFIYSLEFENLCDSYGIAPYSA